MHNRLTILLLLTGLLLPWSASADDELPGLSKTAPKGIDLAGKWVLDKTKSGDPRKQLSHALSDRDYRKKDEMPYHHIDGNTINAPLSQLQFTGKTVLILNSRNNNPDRNMIPGMRPDRNNQFLGLMLFPESSWIKIEQDAEGITINYGDLEFREFWVNEITELKYVAGLEGSIISGWHNGQYVIRTEVEKSKLNIEETFVLTDKKQQLANTITIEGKPLKNKVKVRRIYHKSEN